MELKKVIALAVFVLLLAAGFLVYFVIYLKHPPIQGYVVTNGRDSHGCRLGLGFLWDNSTQSCTEKIYGITIYQVVDFNSCLDAGYPVSENNATHQLQCHSLNGTIFAKPTGNLSKEKNITNYPNNVTLVGNFTITNGTNSS